MLSQCARKLRFRRGAVVRMDTRRPCGVVRLNLTNPVAEHVILLVVPSDLPGPHVPVPHRHTACLHGKAQTFFALAKPLLAFSQGLLVHAAFDEIGSLMLVQLQPLQLGITWPVRRSEMCCKDSKAGSVVTQYGSRYDRARPRGTNDRTKRREGLITFDIFDHHGFACPHCSPGSALVRDRNFTEKLQKFRSETSLSGNQKHVSFSLP